MRTGTITPDSPDPIIAAYVREICHREFGSGLDYPYFSMNRVLFEGGEPLVTREEIDAEIVASWRAEYRDQIRRRRNPTAESVALVLCHG
jgi:hypothetical protein